MKHLLVTFLFLLLGASTAWGFPQNPDQYNPPPNNPPANNPPAYNPAPSLQRPNLTPPSIPPAYNPAPNIPVTYNPPTINPPAHNPPANNPSPTFSQQTNPPGPEYGSSEVPNRRPKANPLAILNAPRPRISLPAGNPPPEEEVPQQQSFPPERKWQLPPYPFDPPKDPPAVKNVPVPVTDDRPPFNPPKGN